MNRLRLAGVVWIVAAVFAIAITIAYRFDMTDSLLWAWITVVASIIAAILGVAFVWRTQAAFVRWSTIAGVTWVVLYAVLALQEADDLAAWPTDAAIGVVGGVAALIAYREARKDNG